LVNQLRKVGSVTVAGEGRTDRRRTRTRSWVERRVERMVRHAQFPRGRRLGRVERMVLEKTSAAAGVGGVRGFREGLLGRPSEYRMLRVAGRRERA